jgi:hypothetical protein
MQRVPQTREASLAFERTFFGHEHSQPESIKDAKYEGKEEKGKENARKLSNHGGHGEKPEPRSLWQRCAGGRA